VVSSHSGRRPSNIVRLIPACVTDINKRKRINDADAGDVTGRQASVPMKSKVPMITSISRSFKKHFKGIQRPQVFERRLHPARHDSFIKLTLEVDASALKSVQWSK
jgi:hypothetical protein